MESGNHLNLTTTHRQQFRTILKSSPNVFLNIFQTYCVDSNWLSSSNILLTCLEKFLLNVRILSENKYKSHWVLPAPSRGILRLIATSLAALCCSFALATLCSPSMMLVNFNSFLRTKSVHPRNVGDDIGVIFRQSFRRFEAR